jgi:hypothetical protein
MVSDKEFVRQRFLIVKERLEDEDTFIERVDRIQLQREYRLLGKLLDEVSEGNMVRALETWRTYLGAELAKHQANHRNAQAAFDNWRRLLSEQRSQTPQSRSPSSGTEVTDQNGYIWVVDDRFLLMCDDLIMRLHKWLDAET